MMIVQIQYVPVNESTDLDWIGPERITKHSLKVLLRYTSFDYYGGGIHT